MPNTNQTDFPVLIAGTFAYLATVANGGDVENANGFDIIFTSDEAGENQLDHEIETYNATTGAINFWVKVPTLLTASDTVIYIHYGNASISTSQENKTGVWSSSFPLVTHLPDGSSLDASDSSPNNHTPIVETSVAVIAGQIDGGADVSAGADNAIRFDDTAALSPTAAITVSMWFKRLGGVGGGPRMLLNKGDGATHAGSSYETYISSSDLIRFEINDGTAWRTAEYSTPITDTTTWHLVHGTFDGLNVKIYVEGILRTTTAFSGSINDSSNPVALGRVSAGPFAFFGALDEVRIASVARSADWIATEFNNQSDPATFFSIGPEI